MSGILTYVQRKAAENDHLVNLKQKKRRDIVWSYWKRARAAEHGLLEVLIWARGSALSGTLNHVQNSYKWSLGGAEMDQR